MSDGIEMYRCKECGQIASNLGTLHAHIEMHRGWHGLQWPWDVGDFDSLMEHTEVLRVTDYEVIDRGEDR